MIILTLFAFLAGIITVLSPCILPILPVILASSSHKANTRARPYGVVIGFILSFTFFTLTLSTIVNFFEIAPSTLRGFSVVVIGVFGLSLLIPRFQLLVESLFARLANFIPHTPGKTGLLGGIFVGMSLGLIWTPCVGPILASVISLAIISSVTLNAVIITLAYSLGTAIPMYLIILGGSHALTRVPYLLSHTKQIQQFFGALMILTALLIHFGLDRQFQTYILDQFPQYGQALTGIEENELVIEELEKGL